MRILLDNCVPIRLVEHLQGFEVETALSMGWDRKRDSELLELMNGKFDVLITVDRKLTSQNRIAACPFAVVTIRAKSNRMRHLLRMLPKLKAALKRVQLGHAIEIG